MISADEVQKISDKSFQNKISEISEHIKEIAEYKNSYSIIFYSEDEARAIGLKFADVGFDVMVYPRYNILFGRRYRLEISW